jgi:hypothetical protein
MQAFAFQKTHKTFIGLLTLCFLLGAAPDTLALSITPAGIYTATKQACSVLPASTFERKNPLRDTLMMPLVRDGIIPDAPRFQEMIWEVRRQTVQSAMGFGSADTPSFASMILESPQFARALEECYPQNPRLHRYFKAIVRRAEVMSKLNAIGALLLFSKSPGLLIKSLGWAANASKSMLLSAKVLNSLARSVSIANESISGLLLLSLIRGDTEPTKTKPREVTVEEFTVAAQLLLPKDPNQSTEAIKTMITSDLEEKAIIEARLQVERDEKVRAMLMQDLDEINVDLQELQRSLKEPPK